MPLYPLGISRSRDVPNVPKQAGGSIDMRWSLAGELACAFIDAPHQSIQPMLHAAALEAIHRRICVLPVQFGMALRDEAEIHSVLEKRGRELIETLDRLDRTCEMALRIATTDSPSTIYPCKANESRPTDERPVNTPETVAPPIIGNANINKIAAASQPQSPLDYIEERRSHYRRLDDGEERERSIVRRFVERLHGYYRQWRKLQSSPSHPIRLAFLVEQDRLAVFRSRLENTCETYREGRCVISGPWPPYSFV